MSTRVCTVCAQLLLLAVHVNHPGEIDCNSAGQAPQNRDPGREGSVAGGGEGEGLDPGIEGVRGVGPREGRW